MVARAPLPAGQQRRAGPRAHRALHARLVLHEGGRCARRRRDRRAGVADGRVTSTCRTPRSATFKDANAHVEATLKGREAAGHVTASVADIGSIDVQSSSVQIGDGQRCCRCRPGGAPGAPWTLKAHVDLPKLIAQLPPGTPPVPDAERRPRPDRPDRPRLDERRESRRGRRLDGDDAGLSSRAAPGRAPGGSTGSTPRCTSRSTARPGATALEAGVHDAKGPIVEIDAKSSASPTRPVFERRRAGSRRSARCRSTRACRSPSDRSTRSLPPSAWATCTGERTRTSSGTAPSRRRRSRLDASIQREAGNASASVLPFDLACHGALRRRERRARPCRE